MRELELKALGWTNLPVNSFPIFGAQLSHRQNVCSVFHPFLHYPPNFFDLPPNFGDCPSSKRNGSKRWRQRSVGKWKSLWGLRCLSHWFQSGSGWLVVVPCAATCTKVRHCKLSHWFQIGRQSSRQPDVAAVVSPINSPSGPELTIYMAYTVHGGPRLTCYTNVVRWRYNCNWNWYYTDHSTVVNNLSQCEVKGTRRRWWW